MTNRKFYRNTFILTVLSEDEPVSNVELDALNYLVTEGPCVLHSFTEATDEVNGQQMARLLVESGSDEGFFNLDPEGNDTLEMEDME